MEHTLNSSELNGSIKINIDHIDEINNFFKEFIDDYFAFEKIRFSSDNSKYIEVSYFNIHMERKKYEGISHHSIDSFLSNFRKHETILWNKIYQPT
jgi:hypothetical protein